jgi:hypothetical protein
LKNYTVSKKRNLVIELNLKGVLKCQL